MASLEWQEGTGFTGQNLAVLFLLSVSVNIAIQMLTFSYAHLNLADADNPVLLFS